MSQPLGRHALVVGGSIAGLCAARALADHFERVTLVERDTLGDTATARKGVPQGRHLHGLLKHGEDVLDELFPGVMAAVVAGGAVPMEFGVDFQWFHQGGWKVKAASGVGAIGVSRPFLEQAVRRRMRMIPNVVCLDDHEVTGLVLGAHGRVSGARVRSRAQEDAPEALVEVDLVVDASGRGSATPRWLEALGRARPEESIITVNVGYASRVYRRPPPGTVPWKACYVIGPAPENKRIGAIFSIEGDRWIAVLAGVLGDHPPTDDAGFLAFARGLPDPAIADALATAEPLDEVATYRFPAHQRRHYERLADLPDGLVVLGDAHCSFNPIYGQGMTCAALGALELRRCLVAQSAGAAGLAGMSRRFQRGLAAVVDGAWLMSTTEDFRYPGVQGRRPAINGPLAWYVGRVHAAVHHDAEVARVFYQAMHMLVPPTALMRPSIAMRVLFGSPKALAAEGAAGVAAA